MICSKSESKYSKTKFMFFLLENMAYNLTTLAPIVKNILQTNLSCLQQLLER